YDISVPTAKRVEEAMDRARNHVPEVLRAFMRFAGVDRYDLAGVMGLTPTQLNRRLHVPGALAQHELAGLAAFFHVPVDTFYKDLTEALNDLAEAAETLRRG